MNYFRAYGYVFDSPKWLTNVLLAMVAMFVPFVGPIVINGYHYEIIEVLHLRGPGRYPDFDFNRLLNYLTRGLWVFLVALIVTLPLTAVGGVLGIGMSVAPPLMENAGWSEEQITTTMIVLISVMFVVALMGNLFFFLLSVPLLLRAGLTQDFAAAFSWTFLRDFIARTWWEMILTMLFLMVTVPFILLAGMLLFCVVLYPAAAYVGFVVVHLYHQLYELYLKRGGTAIPLKVE